MRMAARTLATVCLVSALAALSRGWLLATPPVAQSPATATGTTAPTPSPGQGNSRTLKVRFSWDANTESDLAGYVVSWGDKRGGYTESATLGREATSVELDVALRPEPYYVVVQARNAAGQLSGYSNEFSLDVSSGRAKALKAGKSATPKAKREKPPKVKKPKKPKKQKTTP